MAVDLQQRIDSIRGKSRLLTDRYRKVKQLLDEAQEREAQLREEIGSLKRRLADSEREIERLKVSSVLAPDHRDVEATRSFLSGLVREIDKCIAQLSI